MRMKLSSLKSRRLLATELDFSQIFLLQKLISEYPLAVQLSTVAHLKTLLTRSVYAALVSLHVCKYSMIHSTFGYLRVLKSRKIQFIKRMFLQLPVLQSLH